MSMISQLGEHAGQHSLTFGCGALPADPAVVAAGHEPNGYFWEGLAAYLEPELIGRLELDSEGGAFYAVGAREDLQQLQATLEPLLTQPERVRELIGAAEAAGATFDD